MTGIERYASLIGDRLGLSEGASSDLASAATVHELGNLEIENGVNSITTNSPSKCEGRPHPVATRASVQWFQWHQRSRILLRGGAP